MEKHKEKKKCTDISTQVGGVRGGSKRRPGIAERALLC